MKKFLLSLLCLLCVGIPTNAANEAITGWGTSEKTNYGTYTNGTWTATNSMLAKIDNTIYPTLNGKTSTIGTLTSSSLKNGISSLTLKATNHYKESNGISLKAEIKQGDEVVATHDFKISTIDQDAIFSETWGDIGVEGDFVIVITNNCPSKSTSNKDRVSITSLSWEDASAANADAPKPVTITSALDGADTKVTLECVTEGAEIYYGFVDDNIENIDQLYSAPFTVTENCTVYAYAKNESGQSYVTHLSIVVPYTSFKGVIANAAHKDEVTIVGNFSVLYLNSGYVMLTDGISNMLVLEDHDELAVGDAIFKIEGTAGYSTSLIRLTNVTFTKGGNGATYTPTELTSLSEINYTDNLFDQVVIKGATISDVTEGSKNATLALGDERVALYNRFSLELSDGVDYEVTAYVSRYNDNLQLVPLSVEGGQSAETVKTPVISPNKAEVKPNEEITITCATEGTTIYYTLDGNDPTTESTVYTGPFTLATEMETNPEVTVKAMACYEGDETPMINSKIASRLYHVMNPYCNVITMGNHDNLVTGSTLKYTKHTCTIDDVDYAMYGAHNEIKNQANGIQMNNATNNTDVTKDRFCYIVQVGDNVDLAIESIEVDWSESNSKVGIEIRGSNIPYEVYPNEEYNRKAEEASIKANGVVIGTIDADNTKVVFEKDYNYFAFYPNANGMVVFNSITINYRDPKPLDQATAPSFDEDFVIMADANTITTDALPYHEDWNPKYQLNGGETVHADNVEGNDITETDLDPATLHTLKVWYEHYYHEASTDPKEFKIMTEPKITIDNKAGLDENSEIDFETIGEGVSIYFTIDGSEPVIPSASALNAPKKARVATEGDVYYLNEAEDLSKTHVVSDATTRVVIEPTVKKAGATNKLTTVAVHNESGVKSSVASEIYSDVVTGIDAIEAEAGEAIYFNLQGVRVAEPENGTYIRVSNGKAAKVIK